MRIWSHCNFYVTNTFLINLLLMSAFLYGYERRRVRNKPYPGLIETFESHHPVAGS